MLASGVVELAESNKDYASIYSQNCGMILRLAEISTVQTTNSSTYHLI